MRLYLRQNLHLKVFSLLIAIVWWAVVRGEDARLKDFIVPLDYVNLPESLTQAGRVVDAVTVRLRASEALLRTLTDDRLSAVIDLGRLPLGEQRVPITEGMLRVPAGTEVVRISPDVVPVRIEKRVRRQVPIVADFSGRPPDGYERSGYTVDPPVATVEGPASEVAAVGRATTGTILLEGQTGDLEFEVRPIPDAPSGSRVRVVSPAAPVKVRVSIAQRERS
jgi:YbbR domain-containing protein